MKSTAPTAIALTLFMFLLVLAAALFFLFQGQQTLRSDLENAGEQVRAAEKQQAEIELRNAAVQATLDLLEVSGTLSADESVRLTEQLAESDRLNLTREATEAQLNDTLDSVNATLDSFESQKPLVTIVNPPVDDELLVGEEMELVIVAADHAGINSIDFSIGGSADLLGGNVEDAGLTAVQRHRWTPDVAGEVDIRITATNNNGISNSVTLTLNVIDVATSTPTSTPVPTTATTNEATPEATTEG